MIDEASRSKEMRGLKRNEIGFGVTQNDTNAKHFDLFLQVKIDKTSGRGIFWSEEEYSLITDDGVLFLDRVCRTQFLF